MKKVILTEEEKKSILNLHSFKKMISEDFISYGDVRAEADYGNVKLTKGNTIHVYSVEATKKGVTVSLTIDSIFNKNNKPYISYTHKLMWGTEEAELGNNIQQIINGFGKSVISFVTNDGVTLTLTKLW